MPINFANFNSSMIEFIYFFIKGTIRHLVIWQNWSFGQFYRSKIEGLQIDQLLSLVIFVLDSLMREHLRELRENKKHIILTIWFCRGSPFSRHFK